MNVYELALRHKSLGPVNNEKLEFLGDAVLGLVVVDWLMKRYPKYNEGQLAKLKSAIVSTENLARCADRYLLRPLVKFGPVSASMKADCMEAMIGAHYQDLGLDSATTYIRANILDHFRETDSMDYNSVLLEKLKGVRCQTDTFESGPSHNQWFTVRVTVGLTQGVGDGPTKKEATNHAARDLMSKLGWL